MFGVHPQRPILKVPFDCKIELMAGTTPSHHWIYPLFATEYRAMEQYTEEALIQQYIWLSTSLPAFEGFIVLLKRKVEDSDLKYITKD